MKCRVREARESKPVFPTKVTRRQFLGATTALAAPTLIPSSTLGLNQTAQPSERVTLGIIGVGSRGVQLIHAFLGFPNAQILAVCDPYRSKCEEAKNLIETHYGSGQGSYTGCATYTDFRELIARPDIDAVVVASPEHWHGIHGAMAAEAGKDIYGEKALTLTVSEGRALANEVRRYGRVFQVGLQQRSRNDFRFACELARNGYVGRLHTIQVGVPGGRSLPNVAPAPVPPDLDYEMWLGPAPYTPYNELKCTFNWYFMYDYCVGWIQSWGVHHIDTAQWGAPSLATGQLRVKGTATFPTTGLADTSLTWRVECRTENDLLLRFSDDGYYEHGCRFEGSEGWVHISREVMKAEPPSLLKVVIKPEDEHLYDSQNHQANFLECVRTRREPAAPVEAGHTATTITILADIATRLGRELLWDWESERFVSDEDANRILARPMRAPWAI